MKLCVKFALTCSCTIFATMVVMFCAAMVITVTLPKRFDNKNVTINGAPSIYGIFARGTEFVSIKYATSFDSAGWVYLVLWPLMFLWNIIGYVYLTMSLCFDADSSPVKRDPSIVPVGFLVLSVLSWGGTVGWLFLYDREHLIASMVILIIATSCTYAMMAILYVATTKDALILEEDSKVMLVLTRGLVHNGLGIYATWISILWLLNLQIVIGYDTISSKHLNIGKQHGSLTLEDSGTIILALIMFKTIFWFVLENFVIERYCRYTLTIYPTLIFILAGSYIRMSDDVANYYPGTRNQILNLLALSIVVLAFIIRFPLVIYRHRRRPHY